MMKNTGNVAGTSSQGHSPWIEAWTVSGREGKEKGSVISWIRSCLITGVFIRKS